MSICHYSCNLSPLSQYIFIIQDSSNIDTPVILVGDRFWAEDSQSTYTIMAINGKSVRWDCEGRKHWMKNVTLTSIHEWIRDKRLIKI